jgi:hypothetical protein
MLRVINDVGRFDISGDVLIVGRKAQDAPARGRREALGGSPAMIAANQIRPSADRMI